MSGLTGIGAGVQGFASGLEKGFGIAQRKKEKKIQSQMMQLQVIQQEREFQLKEQESINKQEQVHFDNSLTLLDKYLKGFRPVANTAAGTTYMENISKMPFLENSPQAIKSFAESLSTQTGNNIKTIGGILGTYLNSKKDNDKNGMAQAYFEALAMFGDEPPKGMQEFFDIAKQELFPKETKQTQSNLGKLIAEQKQYDSKSKEYELYDLAKDKAASSSGTNINIDMGKSTKNHLQKNLMNIKNSLSGLKETKKQLTPSVTQFLSVPGQLKSATLSLKRKLGVKSSDTDEQAYDKYLGLVSTYMQTIGEEVHRLYGSALTPTEVKRVTAMFPNINTEMGWKRFLQSDDGRTFVAKLDATINNMTLISDRYTYALKNGSIMFDDEGKPIAFLDQEENPITLENMKEINESKTQNNKNYQIARNEFARLNPNLNEEEIDQITNQFFQQEQSGNL